MSEVELDPLLASLVRKEVLSIQVDPRSPERGQYGFLQDLVKRVAYETLARADRKTLHLVANEPLVEAELRERAGEMAWTGGQGEQAQAHFERAIDLFEAEGRTHPAARVAARLGEVEWIGGRLEHALERMERAYAVLAADEPDADLATLAAQLGRLHFFKGEAEVACSGSRPRLRSRSRSGCRRCSPRR